MSDLDLTEAVEEAARVRYERVRQGRADSTPPWHEASPIHQHAWREGVLAEVTAAAPLIERQVREQVARDIEEQSQYERVRAQRVLRMCAHLARGRAS